MSKDTILLTIPVRAAQKHFLRLGAAEADASMSAFVRGAIAEKLERVRPELATGWDAALPADGCTSV